jgi:hypothetical protein
MRYIISESIISTAALYIVLKKIMTDFTDWDAYKLGIINKDGEKIKTPISSKERDSWDLLAKFSCNFKKLLIRFLGKANYMTYFTMAYLLRDSIDYFYIEHNKEMLHEKYLQDFNMIKQNKLFKIIQEVEKQYGKEVVTEENIEMLVIKYTKIFENNIDINSIL